jgi:preprotein translocase subunit YajC
MDILLLAMMQAQGAPAARSGGMSLLPVYIILFFLFWVMIIIPQRRQAKAHQELVAALQKGDQVVTAGGLIGVVTGVRDDSIELKTGTSTVVVERARITRRVDTSAAPAKQG